jgi:hypothetical protein
VAKLLKIAKAKNHLILLRRINIGSRIKDLMPLKKESINKDYKFTFFPASLFLLSRHGELYAVKGYMTENKIKIPEMIKDFII